MPSGLKTSASGRYFIIRVDKNFMILMSVSMISLILGRCTLTTTLAPSLSMALCTCDIDAAAMGWSSMEAKMSSMGALRSVSIICFTSLKSNGGTSSWSFSNSLAYFSVMRSGREESICANLINDGPSSAKARLRCSATVVSMISPSARSFSRLRNGISRLRLSISTTCPKPCLINTFTIWLIRFMFL
ncbi:hypothetical protein MBAV_004508 [Candidatus Magnetobacterium bavaricum]|uniref:Uncharacterized protein n=1 Tax=Candidatus Magnetobacterium bavaricum TaxID=29290 RepID=A0A0F3GMX3_9BACT|nr:hypothetical protein MBAV_004508 [Candidatus Magnetobacterium bavaricum]